MKACVFHRYGPASALSLEERPSPQLKPGYVLVPVFAAGVNPADWRLRNGQFRAAFRITLPFVPGSDISGEVVAIAPDAKRFRVGDRLFTILPLKAGGGYAEFASVDERNAALVPEGVSLADCASLPLAGLTAWQGLTRHGGLRARQSVLVVGGSGGVGHFAVQMASALGTQVTAVTSARNFDFVRSLGATDVIDRHTANMFAGGCRFDIVFDTVALTPFYKWSAVLKSSGILVTVSPVIGKVLPRLVTKLIGINRLRSFFVEPCAEDLAILADFFQAGKVVPQIEHRWPLANAAEAQSTSEAGHVRGKLLLDIASC